MRERDRLILRETERERERESEKEKERACARERETDTERERESYLLIPRVKRLALSRLKHGGMRAGPPPFAQ